MYCSKMCTFESPVCSVSKVVGQVSFHFFVFVSILMQNGLCVCVCCCLLPLYCCLMLFIAFSFEIRVHSLRFAFVYAFNFLASTIHSSTSHEHFFSSISFHFSFYTLNGFVFARNCIIYPEHTLWLCCSLTTFQYHVPTKECETSKINNFGLH